MNAKQVTKFFKCLMTGPVSRYQIAEQVGAQAKTIGSVLAEMQEAKLIYVIGYSNQTDGRNRVKLYSLGQGKNVKPKPAQPQEDRSRKSYIKKVEKENVYVPKTTFAGGVSLWQ